MSDLFHERVNNYAIADIFGVMAAAKKHTFQILTKRPERAKKWFSWHAEHPNESGEPWPLPNVWIGVSVEDQQAANERIPRLLDIPAALRFVSCEPLIGPVDLSCWIPNIDWLIVGCESGQHRRIMHIDWAQWLEQQCRWDNTPFFLKQMEVDGKLVKMPMLDGKVWAEMPDG
jgi:protein gp37